MVQTGSERDRSPVGKQIFVRLGFAHGCCTLEADTEVAYKVDSYYAPASESGLI
jgi:dTDP-4-dehydrorhamnose 3,5-epimerase